MQFYLDGYRPGDPLVAPPAPGVADRGAELPDHTDVLVVGAGPAGMVLAAQLARFPELDLLVVDRRGGPLAVGQADGVACRTVEVFEALGLADRLLAEAYWVNEVAFWRPDPADPSRIVRTGRVPDTEEGLSEFPHVIVNQARMLAWLREDLDRQPGRPAVRHGWTVAGLAVDDGDPDGYPVTVELTGPAGTARVRARYVVGCDGSRSAVRTAIGRELRGDRTDQRWGVMDVLPVTDFPDIRLKATVHSHAEGNVLVIPREGGYLVRFYIELDQVRDAGEVDPVRLTEIANRILHPYTVEVRDVGWWSVYKIGQRLCDRFDDAPDDGSRAPRVFIAGDACHTHSAKAGQGMNVSMHDAWNLGWKLAAVLRGVAPPELLHTYTAERQVVAQELIDFDRRFAALFSRPPEESDPGEFERYFVQQGRFTAGVATRYRPSPITSADAHQELATGFGVGTRFHSAPVVRLADARPVQLGHAARADGAWRLYLFADRDGSALRALCEQLAGPGSALRRHTPAGWDPDAVLDVRAVLQQHHHDVEVGSLPAVLRPVKGPLGLVDQEKVYCPDTRAGDVFDLRGVDRDGCAVLVRPDQHVAHVLPLTAHAELTAFLAGVLRPV
ncbi:FAD-dependent monooxygenase [Klenkia taihuensis]|uniref:Phenol 2-monooxygenase n=1 Tax=Klenkia taihuensis TaxID=1225127 RepID=A0A1I1Q149_9ACTN|nr:FAD-dependent monooxygenase [Klenkia taihuensis]GHE08239.1 phenol 2-monooxygenase [Klenkia taihuensis]SFD15687.1 phenol 2-monooxygenase [Klenkia taihuensis]